MIETEEEFLEYKELFKDFVQLDSGDLITFRPLEEIRTYFSDFDPSFVGLTDEMCYIIDADRKYKIASVSMTRRDGIPVFWLGPEDDPSHWLYSGLWVRTINDICVEDIINNYNKDELSIDIDFCSLFPEGTI